MAFGIAVMMFLVSLGTGLEQLTLGNVAQSSSLLSLTVQAGSETLQPLTRDSVTRMRAVPNVKDVYPQVTVKGSAVLDKTRASVTIVGVDPGFIAIGDTNKVIVGQAYRPEDTQVMLVSTGYLSLFGLDTKRSPLVDFNIAFDEKDYPNVPTLQNVAVAGVINSSAITVYLPRPYLEGVLGSSLPHYDTVKVVVNSLDSIANVKDTLISYGFRVGTVVDTIQDIQKVFRWIEGVLLILGLVAIVVASIGMFNTLTISLLERTREISIMKALGVRRIDIRKLFITESLLMGILGGLCGVILAYGMQQFTMLIFSFLASIVNGVVPTIFLNPWYEVVGFFLLATVIAGLTGLYPAMRAARLNPIEGIRYE